MRFSTRWLAAGLLCAELGTGFAQTAPGGAQQALAFEHQGQWSEAAAAWRQVLTQRPKDAAACGHLGIALAHEGDYSGAAEAYRRALALNPRMTGLDLDLGLALFKQGKLQEAIAPLKRAAAAAPRSQQPRILLGMSYFGSAQYAAAVPYLRFALQQSPQNQELRSVLAQACLYARQFQCTLDQYKQIVAANPDSAPAHMLAGEADDGLNNTAAAVAEFQAAEMVAPREPNVHFGLGYLFLKQHKFDAAAREFQLELDNDPNHAQALAWLGDTQMKLQQPAAAQATLQRAVQLPGAARMAFVDLGILLADAGRNDEAAANFQHAIQMDPSQVDAHWRLARLYQSEGKRAEAQAEFAKSAALHQHQDESLVKQMTPPKQ